MKFGRHRSGDLMRWECDCHYDEGRSFSECTFFINTHNLNRTFKEELVLRWYHLTQLPALGGSTSHTRLAHKMLIDYLKKHDVG